MGLSLIGMTLSGCGGGGGGGTAAGPGNPSPTTASPTLVLVSPKDKDTDVSAFSPITMTFDKPMNPDTFHEGLTFTPLDPSKNYHLSFACAPNDCKTIILTHGASFDYTGVYTFTLLTGSTGIKDIDGNTLASPSSWKFTVSGFKADRNFLNLKIDGGGMHGDQIDINGQLQNVVVDDAGECTSIAVDSLGTIHIAYLSVSDRAAKHAWCEADCNLLNNWHKEIIDQGTTSQGLGRDINMVIDQSNIHVSYRDYGGDPTMIGSGILKYATKSITGPPGSWRSVIVHDTNDEVTDTFIKVSDNGRIHISYHAEKALYYASCFGGCLTHAEWGTPLRVDEGENYGQPNFLFVTDSPAAAYISYYADGKLKYTACPLTGTNGSCEGHAVTAIVDESPGDIGTENSLFVNQAGAHITYRSVNPAGEESMKYAFCSMANGVDCSRPVDWKAITIDSSVGAGRSTQIKIDSGNHIHVVYGDSVNGDLKYAFCDTNCLTPSQWSLNVIDALGVVGHDNYLALGPDENTVYLSYRDHGNEALKIAFGPSPFSP